MMARPEWLIPTDEPDVDKASSTPSWLVADVAPAVSRQKQTLPEENGLLGKVARAGYETLAQPARMGKELLGMYPEAAATAARGLTVTIPSLLKGEGIEGAARATEESKQNPQGNYWNALMNAPQAASEAVGFKPSWAGRAVGAGVNKLADVGEKGAFGRNIPREFTLGAAEAAGDIFAIGGVPRLGGTGQGLKPHFYDTAITPKTAWKATKETALLPKTALDIAGKTGMEAPIGSVPREMAKGYQNWKNEVAQNRAAKLTEKLKQQSSAILKSSQEDRTSINEEGGLQSKNVDAGVDLVHRISAAVDKGMPITEGLKTVTGKTPINRTQLYNATLKLVDKDVQIENNLLKTAAQKSGGKPADLSPLIDQLEKRADDLSVAGTAQDAATIRDYIKTEFGEGISRVIPVDRVPQLLSILRTKMSAATLSGKPHLQAPIEVFRDGLNQLAENYIKQYVPEATDTWLKTRQRIAQTLNFADQMDKDAHAHVVEKAPGRWKKYVSKWALAEGIGGMITGIHKLVGLAGATEMAKLTSDYLLSPDTAIQNMFKTVDKIKDTRKRIVDVNPIPEDAPSRFNPLDVAAAREIQNRPRETPRQTFPYRQDERTQLREFAGREKQKAAEAHALQQEEAKSAAYRKKANVSQTGNKQIDALYNEKELARKRFEQAILDEQREPNRLRAEPLGVERESFEPRAISDVKKANASRIPKNLPKGGPENYPQAASPRITAERGASTANVPAPKKKMFGWKKVISSLNEDRVKQGLPPLTDEEAVKILQDYQGGQ